MHEHCEFPFVGGAAYPMRPGNCVRPLVDGAPAFRRICDAVESAQHSVSVTVAFLHAGFVMPDGRGSFFDVLDCAARRGLDVRVIFWRDGPDTQVDRDTVFAGLAEQRDLLRGCRFSARWDHAREARCHHQKSWIVDAGHPGEVAFVGGINLNPRSLVDPGHGNVADSNHDVYIEMAGPSATDVHRNFVQRWNDATEPDTWGSLGASSLSFPRDVSASRGDSFVQIQRTSRVYGERTIFEQYKLAIDAAQRCIYIENQALEHPEIIACLGAALDRGVVVVALVPVEVEPAARAARAVSEQLARLGQYENFTMSGIAAQQPDGTRRTVHVHAKIMLVDDVFATVGSCNLRAGSLFLHTELNASVYDPVVVAALRRELFLEHLNLDTASLDDMQAHSTFAATARANASRREHGDGKWQGLAFALDPATTAQ